MKLNSLFMGLRQLQLRDGREGRVETDIAAEGRAGLDVKAVVRDDLRFLVELFDLLFSDIAAADEIEFRKVLMALARETTASARRGQLGKARPMCR